MRHKFCCDASRQDYERYYINQSGTGLTVFSGSRGQRGRGIGSTISGFFRNSLPFIKKGLSAFGKQAARTSLEILGDVLGQGDDKKSFMESLESRGKAGIKSLASEALDHLKTQSGSGSRKRKRSSKSKKGSKRAKKSRAKKKKNKKKKKKRKKKKSHFNFL